MEPDLRNSLKRIEARTTLPALQCTFLTKFHHRWGETEAHKKYKNFNRIYL